MRMKKWGTKAGGFLLMTSLLATMPIPVVAAEAGAKSSVVIDNFNGHEWGAGKDEVMSQELPENPVEGVDYTVGMSGNLILIPGQKVLDYSAQGMYIFDDDYKLMEGVYYLTEDRDDYNAYYDDYCTLLDSYTEKYGEPYSTEENWEDPKYKNTPELTGLYVSVGWASFNTVWMDEEGDRLTLYLTGDSGKVDTMITYESAAFIAMSEDARSNKAEQETVEAVGSSSAQDVTPAQKLCDYVRENGTSGEFEMKGEEQSYTGSYIQVPSKSSDSNTKITDKIYVKADSNDAFWFDSVMEVDSTYIESIVCFSYDASGEGKMKAVYYYEMEDGWSFEVGGEPYDSRATFIGETPISTYKQEQQLSTTSEVCEYLDPTTGKWNTINAMASIGGAAVTSGVTSTLDKLSNYLKENTDITLADLGFNF